MPGRLPGTARHCLPPPHIWGLFHRKHGRLGDGTLEDVLAGDINHLADAGLEALPT